MNGSGYLEQNTEVKGEMGKQRVWPPSSQRERGDGNGIEGRF